MKPSHIRFLFSLLLACVCLLVLSACAFANLPQKTTATITPTPTPLQTTTWYIRADGGTAAQCNGKSNTPYIASQPSPDCAWNHPAIAIPNHGQTLFKGGDTLIIADGDYKLGTTSMPALTIPASPNASQPTRILGEAWQTGCVSKPRLVGTGGIESMMDVIFGSNIDLQCLELMDEADCAIGHPQEGFNCVKDNIHEALWAQTGLRLLGSSNIHLENLSIHGLAQYGILSTNASQWQMNNITLTGNGWGGWVNDSNHAIQPDGIMQILALEAGWNGCVEHPASGTLHACQAQPEQLLGIGIYAGVNLQRWIIEDSRFTYNTLHGLDLSQSQKGTFVEIDRSYFEGNAASQLRVAGELRLSNSILIGNCGWFASHAPDGSTSSSHVSACHAAGNTLELFHFKAQRAHLLHNTITGEGSYLVNATCWQHEDCLIDERVLTFSNIFYAQPQFYQPAAFTGLFSETGFAQTPYWMGYNALFNLPAAYCESNFTLCPPQAGLTNTDINHFNAAPLASSAMLKTSPPEYCPAWDFFNQPRAAQGNCDVGAIELQP